MKSLLLVLLCTSCSLADLTPDKVAYGVTHSIAAGEDARGHEIGSAEGWAASVAITHNLGPERPPHADSLAALDRLIDAIENAASLMPSPVIVNAPVPVVIDHHVPVVEPVEASWMPMLDWYAELKLPTRIMVSALVIAILGTLIAYRKTILKFVSRRKKK